MYVLDSSSPGFVEHCYLKRHQAQRQSIIDSKFPVPLRFAFRKQGRILQEPRTR